MPASPSDLEPTCAAAHCGVIAIVPTFNSIETLPEVLDGIARHGLPILVVDDGSTDGTAPWLAEWVHAGVGEADRNVRAVVDRDAGRAKLPALSRHVLIQSANGGKAMALLAGFAEARRLGFNAAVTLDADGQHDPDDLPQLLEMAQRAGPTALIRGRRDESTSGYPWRRLLGRRLNDLAIRAQTGLLVRDSPCGYRVYPLRLVENVRCRSGRYAWEEELITRAAWSGWAIREVPVACRYAGDGEARSHYRFRRDWPEGFAINLLLLARAALPIPRAIPRSGPHREPSIAARLNDVIGVAMLRRARTDPIERWRIGAAVMLGLALGLGMGFGSGLELVPGRGTGANPGVLSAFLSLSLGVAVLLWLCWRWHIWLPGTVIATVIGWVLVP